MHDQGTSEAAYLRNQQTVLGFVLSEFPAVLTFKEIEMEVESRINAEDAVQDLTAAGLLHREGELVLPTRAARRFQRVEQS